MSEEHRETPAKAAGKPGIRVAQVLAGALAAVTAALLGSTLGVAGTVLGAGVASVVTAVGGELYLRSLQRTREAAQRARVAARALTVPGTRLSRAQRNLAEQPTVQLLKPGEDGPPPEPGSWLRQLRWPLIIGTSLIAFVIAILVITGFEGATGSTFGGGSGTTIGHIFGSTSGSQTKTQTPSTSETTSSTPSDTQTTSATPTTSSTTSGTPTSSSTSETTTTTTTESTSNSSTTPSASVTPTPTRTAN